MKNQTPWERGPAGPPQTRYSSFSGPAGPRSRAQAQPRAFTLVEVLLALAVFAIGFAMVAVVPSGATLLEKRYEQIVEGELASNNVIELLASRRAFWPMHECLYANGQLLSGGYSPNQGTKSLNYLAFDPGTGTNDGYAATADASGSGQLKPLVSLCSTLINGPETRSLDADAQGDFEDFQCNGDRTGVAPFDPDGLWGSVVSQTENESAVYWRVFDTNNNHLNLASGVGLYGTTGYVGCDFFFDGNLNDRTHFAKGRIHLCHNRLTPANLYPLELRSYPMAAPLTQRRVFVSLAYVDKNTNANGRQWQLYSVAHAKASDDQWTEASWAMDYNTLKVISTGQVCDLPNSSIGTLTQGDVSVLKRNVPSGYTPPSGQPNWPMLANDYGLFDTDATDFTSAAFSAAAVPAAVNNSAFNHSFLDWVGHYNGGWGTNHLVNSGSVTPLCGTAAEVVLYPTLMQLPAIIYDWDNSLIQVAYPKEYVPVPYTAGGPVQSDRRLKIGDKFMSVEAGVQFTVQSVKNESRPQYAAADQPFFQIVTVSPPLNTTPLGGAKTTFSPICQGYDSSKKPIMVPNATLSNGNSYPYWRLCHIYMAPAATGKTVSSWSWSSTTTGDHFMTANPNQ